MDQTRATRKPTGKPSWPMLLLAGPEKVGKTWAWAAASASDLIGRTFVIPFGEDAPDEEGAIPGADFDIVEHNGTYRDLLNAIDWVAARRSPDGKPVLLVIDSMTKLWELLSSTAQHEANERAAAKARKANRLAPEDDVQITMDLWNTAKDRHSHVVAALRAHPGPVLLTARMDEVTVMVDGKPTADKTLRIKTEKSLPYDVGGIVEMPERGKTYLSGIRSTRLQFPKRVPLPGFTVDGLWRKLGLAEDASEIGPRQHAAVVIEPGVEQEPAQPAVVETDATWLADMQQDINRADMASIDGLWRQIGQGAKDGKATAADAAALAAAWKKRKTGLIAERDKGTAVNAADAGQGEAA